jgi:serine protease Do
MGFGLAALLVTWAAPGIGLGAAAETPPIVLIDKVTGLALPTKPSKKPAPARKPKVKSGTAFFVTFDGKALTSAHLVQHCRDITLWRPDLAPYPGKVVAIDPRSDLALLSISDTVPDIAEFGTEAATTAGMPVTTIGFGIDRENPQRSELTKGTLTGDEVLPSGTHVLVIDAKLGRGNSGGPVIDENGAVLGLVIGRYTDQPDLGVAVPAPELGAFLAKHGVTPIANRPSTEDNPPATRSASDLASRLTVISALVQCTPDLPAHTHARAK